MKHLLRVLMVSLALLLVACEEQQTIQFADETLELALRDEINKDDHLEESDFLDIVEMDLSGLEITELDGIEVLKNVESLSLENNKITDFSILSELDNLNEVNVIGNPIDDNLEQQEILTKLSDQGVIVKQSEEEIVGQPDGPGGFLWEVAHGDTTVYLQGTVHLGVEEMFPLNEKSENAYKESDIILPEVDIANLNPFEVQEIMVELGTYQDGSTIQDHISEELYVELENTLEELGLPIQLLETYHPWVLSSMVQQLIAEQLGFIHGVDEYFLTRAHDDEKEVIALETVEEQFQLFADTSPEYQEDMLAESLMSMKEYEEDLDELISLYMKGDQEALLSSLINEEAEVNEEDQAFMEALNDKRNIGMANKIKEFLEDDNGKTYFVIVGSLHYILEPHIISLLEEDGYEVKHIY